MKESPLKLLLLMESLAARALIAWELAIVFGVFTPARAAPLRVTLVQNKMGQETSGKRFDASESLRRDQRQRLVEGVSWVKVAVFIPFIVALVVAIILLITPRELYTIRPFDKNRDRKQPAAPPEESSGYRDSDFHW